MAVVRRTTEINNNIIMVETMIIVGDIALCTIHINGELVDYEILSIGQLWKGYQTFPKLVRGRQISYNQRKVRLENCAMYIAVFIVLIIIWKMIEDQ